MANIFPVYAEYEAGPLCEAVFWSRAAAVAWQTEQNDAVQAELYVVDELPLIDNYGFPFAKREIADVWPGHAITQWPVEG